MTCPWFHINTNTYTACLTSSTTHYYIIRYDKLILNNIIKLTHPFQNRPKGRTHHAIQTCKLAKNPVCTWKTWTFHPIMYLYLVVYNFLFLLPYLLCTSLSGCRSIHKPNTLDRIGPIRPSEWYQTLHNQGCWHPTCPSTLLHATATPIFSINYISSSTRN